MTFHKLIFDKISDYANSHGYNPRFILVDAGSWELFTYENYRNIPSEIPPKQFNSQDYIGGKLFGLRLLRVLDLKEDFIIT